MAKARSLVAKLIAHWLSFGPLLLVAALPAATLLKLDLPTILVVEAGLALGHAGTGRAGAAGRGADGGIARQRRARRAAGAALAIPILIFGAGSLGLAGIGALKLVAASSLVLIVLCPLAGGAALRAGRD